MKVLENIGQFVAGKMKLVYNVIDNHKRDTNNPHKVTKSDVGLGNVDNTSDADKPLSNAASNALGSINESLNASKNVIDEIRYGSIVIGKSEYAEKLGTPTDNFTKKQIDQILDALLSNVDLDPETFSLSFSYRDGRSKTFDLPIEDTVKDGRYDEEARELVLVLVSGQEIRIQAPGLLKVYIGGGSSTTTVSINEGNGEITVDVEERSITKGHLTTELQTEIDKLANVPENANDTFAKKEELKALSGFNTLYIDITDIEDASKIEDGALNEYLINQIKNFDFDKCCQVVFIWYDDRYLCNLVTTNNSSNSYIIIVEITDDDLVDFLDGDNLVIKYKKAGSVSLMIRYEGVSTLFLNENLDLVLAPVDGSKWNKFANEVKAGKFPMVFIKSTYVLQEISNGYVPARYEFAKNDTTGEMQGFVEISYPKTTDGVSELWIERWTFTDFNGMGSPYTYGLKKIPLQDTNILTINLDLIQNGETISNSRQLKASIEEQAAGFNFDGKFDVRFIKDNTVFSGGNTMSVNSTFTLIKSEIPFGLNLDYNEVDIMISFADNAYTCGISTFLVPYEGVIFLTENADGYIGVKDKNWKEYATALSLGLNPSVYIKSQESGIYYPAAYDFTKDASGSITGTIETSYTKTTNGITELWTEKWIFANGIGINALYDHTISKLLTGNPVSVV